MAATDDLAVMERLWNELYLARDVEGFAALLDDEVRYLSEQGEFDKATYVENLREGAIEMRELETLGSLTRRFGDIAIVTGSVSMAATFQGKDISGVDLYTRIWRHTSDGWIALGQHANRKGDGQ